jgi:hypothetical protein
MCLISACVFDSHEDRTHLGLEKDTPTGRTAEIPAAGESKIQSFLGSAGYTIAFEVAA